VLHEKIETLIIAILGLALVASIIAFVLGHTDAAIYFAILVLASVQALR
jgi:hypothetical protein